MIKKHVHLVKRIIQSNCFNLLCDEVCDISVQEQLLTFIKFVDPTGRATTEFLALDDMLENFHSANAEAIKAIVIKQLENANWM